MSAPQFRVHAPGTTTEDDQIHIQGDATAAEKAIQDATTASSTHAEGSATIKQDENVCVVQHGLGTAPNTIKLDGIDEQRYFSYIVEVTDQQFQVNLHVPAEQDIPFTWTADI